MKLEEGMYIRTKYGEIAKIDKCCGKDETYKNMEYYETDEILKYFNNFIIYKEDIKKASHNIIDLIEEGDYVNGEKVTSKFDYLLSFGNADYYLNNKDIKTIVTKEQFKSMQYEVE